MKHKLLPRPFFFTFDTEDEARSYGSQLEALLKRSIVPQELLTKPERADDPLLTRVASDYSAQFPVTRSDSALLSVVLLEIVGVRLSGVTYRWVEQYVSELKRKRNLAPGTIRKRIGLPLALTRIDPFLLTKADPQRGLGERSARACWSVRRKGRCSGC
ncbi:hypothetical protein [Accumulibacter sp.]|uniref:hypothetical protein n=1 Tax=Accumulibacter sp. TaxID=2053492 RepID=UPI0035B1BA5F